MLRQVVRLLLLDRLEQETLPAGTTEHEVVINVGIGDKVGGVDVLRKRRAT